MIFQNTHYFCMKSIGTSRFLDSNGTAVYGLDFKNNRNQRWRIVPVGSPSVNQYYVINLGQKDNRYLDNPSGETLVVSTEDNRKNAIWSLEPSGTASFRITNVTTKFRLDNRVEDGEGIVFAHEANSGDNQCWVLMLGNAN